eukprot:5669529-Amphidinium_carterae.1
MGPNESHPPAQTLGLDKGNDSKQNDYLQETCALNKACMFSLVYNTTSHAMVCCEPQQTEHTHQTIVKDNGAIP